jgi:poly(3-hydroxybutyrate) depolymerase
MPTTIWTRSASCSRTSSLVNGTWDVRGVEGKIERVRPQDITTTALLTVEGELDDISGSGQTEAVHAICSGVERGKQKHYEVKGAGHYGIFSGRRWRDMVYPQVKAFILQYQPAKPQADTTSAVAAQRPTAPRKARSKPVAAKPAAAPRKAPAAARKKPRAV